MKKATPGPWKIEEDALNGKDGVYCHWHNVGPLELKGKEADANDRLVAFLVSHASELLQSAREIERMKCMMQFDVEGRHLANCPTCNKGYKAPNIAIIS